MAKKEQSLSGPKSEFRGKLRDQPLTLALTQEGRTAVIENALYFGMSRTDYVERWARQENKHLRNRDGDFDKKVRATKRARSR